MRRGRRKRGRGGGGGGEKERLSTHLHVRFLFKTLMIGFSYPVNNCVLFLS